MKMNVTDKASLLGGIFLMLIMIIQLYSNYSFDSSFNEFHGKSIEYAKRDFVDAGFSEIQASAISYRIHDEVSALKSNVSSQNMTQSVMTVFSCLIVLMFALWALKKSNESD